MRPCVGLFAALFFLSAVSDATGSGPGPAGLVTIVIASKEFCLHLPGQSDEERDEDRAHYAFTESAVAPLYGVDPAGPGIEEFRELDDFESQDSAEKQRICKNMSELAIGVNMMIMTALSDATERCGFRDSGFDDEDSERISAWEDKHKDYLGKLRKIVVQEQSYEDFRRQHITQIDAYTEDDLRAYCGNAAKMMRPPSK